MTAILQNKIKGEYILTVRRADGSIKRELQFENIITNNGLDLLMGGTTFNTYCSIGSGTSTPTVSQTALDNRLASSSTQQTSSTTAQGSAPYYTTRSITYRFAAVPAGGYTVNEIGVGAGSTGTNLFSRALILDGSGNPITLTLLESEILDATYIVRNYPALTGGDYTQSAVNISGTNYTFTWRALLVTNASYWNLAPINSPNMFTYTGALGTVTASAPGGTNLGSATGTLSAYVTGSYERQGNITFGLNASNGTIASLYVTNSSGQAGPYAYQASLSPSLTKTSSQQLILAYKISFARA